MIYIHEYATSYEMLPCSVVLALDGHEWSRNTAASQVHLQLRQWAHQAPAGWEDGYPTPVQESPDSPVTLIYLCRLGFWFRKSWLLETTRRGVWWWTYMARRPSEVVTLQYSHVVWSALGLSALIAAVVEWVFLVYIHVFDMMPKKTCKYILCEHNNGWSKLVYILPAKVNQLVC
jgi:hypothetical protein